MEIRPVTSGTLRPEQGKGQTAARQPGTPHHSRPDSAGDAIGEFSFDRLMKLAETALAAGNPTAALNNFARILRYEPDNYRALYGTILAEGLQSPDALLETLGRLERLLRALPEGERERLEGQAGRDILALGQKLEAEAVAAIIRKITPAGYDIFSTRMEQVLELYRSAAQLLPNQEGVLLAMIAAAERLMVPYRDQRSGRKFHPPPGIYGKGKEWLREARDLLKQRFPSLFQRLLLYQKYRTCFVATAAWGDPCAEEVMALRAFRDLYLKRSPAGRRFIVRYYRYGPLLAGIIRQHRVLRAAARALLVPLLRIVRTLPGVRTGGASSGGRGSIST